LSPVGRVLVRLLASAGRLVRVGARDGVVVVPADDAVPLAAALRDAIEEHAVEERV
jgi:hypothetical protein